jgi:hypothetical protein
MYFCSTYVYYFHTYEGRRGWPSSAAGTPSESSIETFKALPFHRCNQTKRTGHLHSEINFSINWKKCSKFKNSEKYKTWYQNCKPFNFHLIQSCDFSLHDLVPTYLYICTYTIRRMNKTDSFEKWQFLKLFIKVLFTQSGRYAVNFMLCCTKQQK